MTQRNPPPRGRPRRALQFAAAVGAAGLVLVSTAAWFISGSSRADPYSQALRDTVRWLDAHAAAPGGYTKSPASTGSSGSVAETEATATVALALMHAYEATRDHSILAAVRRIAALAEDTQLGDTYGWTQHLYVHGSAVQPEGTLFYRTDQEAGRKPVPDSDITVYRSDHEQTTGLLKVLMRLDLAEGRRDKHLEQVVTLGIRGLLHAQYLPSGGYPDWYLTCGAHELYPSVRCTSDWRVARAMPPSSVPPRSPYVDDACSDPSTPGVTARVQFYSLNDGTANKVMDTLFEAWRWSHDRAYYRAAVRLADWMLRAQFPEPQPGWSQFYDAAMAPRWGRAYEPVALSTTVTFETIRSLVTAYHVTGDRRYRNAALAAFRWVWARRLPNHKWPFFVQFRTNAPLYVSDGTHGTVRRCDTTTDPAYATDWPDYGLLISSDFPLAKSEMRHIDDPPCRAPTRRQVRAVRLRADLVLRQLAADQAGGDAFVVANDVNVLAEYVAFRSNRYARTWLNPNGGYRFAAVRESPCRYIAGLH